MITVNIKVHRCSVHGGEMVYVHYVGDAKRGYWKCRECEREEYGAIVRGPVFEFGPPHRQGPVERGAGDDYPVVEGYRSEKGLKVAKDTPTGVVPEKPPGYTAVEIGGTPI